MKKFLVSLTLATAALAAPVFAADVGVSINVGQPGFFGRIDIGGAPPPRLIAPRPVVIERIPVGVHREPVYLHVPVEHQRNWRRYCSRYEACGQPVYFIDDRWYNDVYVPHYREHHGPGYANGRREEWREERRENERREEHREERREDRREEERRDEHRDRDDRDHDHDRDHDRH